MENWCSTRGWAEEAINWVQSQDGLERETSLVAPWILPPSDIPMALKFDGYPSSCSVPFKGVEEDRAESASKSHSQAEKRRRDRINSQLATLRKLIPKSDKMDKAALLGNVVERVKELKRKAFQINKDFTIPSETDEVTVDSDFDKSQSPVNSQTRNNDIIMINASFCCDDRPELFPELTQALKGLKLTIVRANMSCLGGRIRSILDLCCEDTEESVCMKSLKQSLKVVLRRIVFSSSNTGLNYRVKSKRQRFFLSSH